MTDLFSLCAGAPALPGARCRGKPHLFDPATTASATEADVARHRQALSLCSRCPSRAPCEQWLEALPASQRPPGIVAGAVVDNRGRIRRSGITADRCS